MNRVPIAEPLSPNRWQQQHQTASQPASRHHHTQISTLAACLLCPAATQPANMRPRKSDLFFPETVSHGSCLVDQPQPSQQGSGSLVSGTCSPRAAIPVACRVACERLARPWHASHTGYTWPTPATCASPPSRRTCPRLTGSFVDSKGRPRCICKLSTIARARLRGAPLPPSSFPPPAAMIWPVLTAWTSTAGWPSSMSHHIFSRSAYHRPGHSAKLAF